MVFLRKKIVKGKPYWYVVEAARVDGKVKTIFQVYLGSAEKILEMKRQCESLPYDKLRACLKIKLNRTIGIGFMHSK